MSKFLTVVMIGCFFVVWGCGKSEKEKNAFEEKMAQAVKENDAHKKKVEEAKAEAAKPKAYVEEKKAIPPIIEAADKADWEKVKSLAASGDVNVKDERGRTALLISAAKGNKEVFDILLAKGADFKAKRADGDTALLSAAKSGKIEIVNTLLEKGMDPMEVDNFGRTALMMAADSGNKAVVELFVGKGLDVNAKDKYNKTPIIFAVKGNHTEIAKYLIAKGAIVKPPKVETDKEKEKKIELKLKETAHDQTQESRDKTVLFYAVENGNLELVKLLVSKGAPVLVTDVKKFKENFITQKNGQDEVEVKEHEEKEERTAYEEGQKNLLMYAAEGGWLEIMKFLVSKGAKIEETDGDMVRNPLFYVLSQNKADDAKEKRLTETAAYLIREGKKMYKHKRKLTKKEVEDEVKKQGGKAWFKKTPGQARYKFEDRPKIDLNGYCYEGWTVLALASMYGHFDIVKDLLDNGALLNLKERKFGKTALMYSRAGNFKEIEQYLLSKGAKEGVNFDAEEDLKKEKKAKEEKEQAEKEARKGKKK